MLSDFDEFRLDAFVAESDGSAKRENAELLYAFGSNDYYLCVSIKRPDLLEELNTAQEQLTVEEPNYINSLRIKYYPSSISSRSFSADEKQWLMENDSLSIGYLKNYLPYSGSDAQGNVTGLVKELVPDMLDSMGISDLEVIYTGYDNFDDMITDIGLGKIDVAFPVGGGLYYSEENNIYQSAQNMAYKYVDDLYTHSLMDTIQDNMWFVALIAMVIFSIIVIFLLRESRESRRRALEREEAGKVLEEKNPLGKDRETSFRLPKAGRSSFTSNAKR